MNTLLRITLSTTICTLAMGATQAYAKESDAQAIQHGKEIVQKDCTRCHGDEVYTRSDRRVKSLAALSKQVQRCKENVGAQLFDEDVNDVVKYLNSKYYKF